uniref:C2H2-type domain-containing protein n=1 Tax=Oryza punctata TaxID=4537 RepID=A0A0E0KHT5_ORYPU
MAVNSGDHARSRGHQSGFVPEGDDDDEEGVAVVGEDYPYCSDSDSADDDDVDRYVFLARQPAPPVDRDDADADEEKGEVQDHGAEGTGCCNDDDGFSPRQPALLDGSGSQEAAEEDDDKGSSDDDDAIAPGGEAGGGGGRGIGKAMDAPVSRKKARLVDLIRSPLVSAELDGSDKAAPPPPRGVCPKKIAVQAKNRKRRRFVDTGEEQEPRPLVRGKRSMVPDLEESEGLKPAATTAATEEAELEEASKRFVCSICGRFFGSHQALGGHVLGHKKKAKNAAIAAACAAAARDATTAVTVAVAPARQRQDFFADINEQDERGCDGAEGSRYDDEKNAIVDDVAACQCHDTAVDESRGHGKAETASAIDACADADNKVAHGDGEENDKIAGVVASSHNGDSDVGKTKMMQHKCEECGKVCLTGQALGGHMSKHRRTRSAANVGDGPSTATVADGGAQTVRLIGDDVCLQRALAIAGVNSA